MAEKVKKLKLAEEPPKTEFRQAWIDIRNFDEDAAIGAYVIAFTYEDEEGQKQIAFSHSQSGAELAELVGLATFLQHFLLNESADMADEYLH
jgi:hypothetical protein